MHIFIDRRRERRGGPDPPLVTSSLAFANNVNGMDSSSENFCERPWTMVHNNTVS